MLLQNYFFRISQTKEYFFYALAFSIPINQKLSTILLIITAIISSLNFKKKDFRPFFRTLLPLLILYIIYIMAYARDEMGFGGHLFEKKASLIIFPLIFFGQDLPFRKNILKYFVYGCITSYLICLVTALFTSFNGYGFDFVKEIPNKSLGFIEAINYNANRLLGSSFITTGFQRSYLAMYFSVAICIVWFSFNNHKIGIKLLVSLLLIIGIIQTWSLAGILTLLTVMLFLIFFAFKGKIIKSVLLVSLSLFLLGVISFNNRANFMYKTIISGNLNINGPTATTVRLRPWVASINEIKKRPIFGYGMESSQKKLNEYYQSQLDEHPQFKWPLEENFNSHNQYFQILIESGIIGLFALFLVVSTFILNLYNFKADFRLIGWGFLIIILLNFLFESMMNRYMGISFMAFFYSLFMPLTKK